MAFTGTLDKCKACDKTVYVVDLLSLEGNPYHKSCFKCSHCKGTLSMSSYSWMDGVLYCKPHFEQLFKESGNFSKNFHASKPSEKQNDLTRAPSKLSSMFSGTQDKCSVCSKTVYPLEKVTLEGECYHKTCFRCAHGGCNLTHSNAAALDGVLYCKHHFAQLFMVKGNYNHVLQAAANKKASTPPPEPADDEAEPQAQSEDHDVEQS
ncbi:LIM domain-containing protein PLIM2c-like [Momordica charantia]|uniref:LIM domain-containing protein PLIM2c-like n=1 Tax=Momordica charantia TaxID=3673 RepID=A0A6J1D1H7_MOMCH|nr:LIM domain-containing protein PLIM2c-like [Momordica charantia]XP_022147509.1 LIM domain-containing protein PLIM2c-like [Momordica charantia]